ncbi:MAG: hypothetical protein ABJF23_23475 [Bryobacteraceae bacterium]
MKPRLLAHIPEELTAGRLVRLGEGIGKIVYASPHWVVKRERSPSEIVALILLWKVLRKFARIMPGHLGERLLQRPSRLIRFLRVVMQAVMQVVPRSVWFTTHIAHVWKVYHFRDRRGTRLARTHLAGTGLMPERVCFPPARIQVGGWPGWLTVSEATERVDDTLHHRLKQLANEDAFAEVEAWLGRLLDLRQRGWRRGLFSLDAHLKNFGVIGDRIVLLDPGGLTDRLEDVEEHLSELEEATAEPHTRLGLGTMLGSRPDIAERFNSRWKEVVSLSQVLEHWPDEQDAS